MMNSIDEHFSFDFTTVKDASSFRAGMIIVLKLNSPAVAMVIL